MPPLCVLLGLAVEARTPTKLSLSHDDSKLGGARTVMPLSRGRVASWVREASRPGGNLSQYETFVGIAGSAGTVGNYMRPAEAYAQKMTQCQVIVTCNPGPHEGDSRLAEALASGALVLVDRMVAPPPELDHGRNMLFYDDEPSLMANLMWALREPSQADAIARAGKNAWISPTQMADRVLLEVSRSTGVPLPVRTFIVQPRPKRPNFNLGSFNTVVAGFNSSPYASMQKSPALAQVVILDAWRLMEADCTLDGVCVDQALRRLTSEHTGSTIVALDFSDAPGGLLPGSVDSAFRRAFGLNGGALNDSSKVHFVFKRSRVDRQKRMVFNYGRQVLPLYYPLQPAKLAAITEALALEGRAPRAVRRLHVCSFFEPSQGRPRLQHVQVGGGALVRRGAPGTVARGREIAKAAGKPADVAPPA